MSQPSRWPPSSHNAAARSSADAASSLWPARRADRSAANQPWRVDAPVESQTRPPNAPASAPAQTALRNPDGPHIPMWKQLRMARESGMASSSRPVDEDPAPDPVAAAPPADAPAFGSLVASADSSAMLRLLGVDSGARFCLCELLSLSELAALHSSCRSWRNWLNTGQLRSGRLFVAKDADIPQNLLACSWVKMYLQCVRFKQPDTGEEAVPVADPNQFLRKTLSLLTQLPRLYAVDLQLNVSRDSGLILQTRFAKLGNRLECLQIDSTSPFDALFVRSLFGAVGSLVKLHVLHVQCKLDRRGAVRRLDFSGLAGMPNLCIFKLKCSVVSLELSAEQVHVLARCSKLQTIEAGAWTASMIRALVEGRVKCGGGVPVKQLWLESSVISTEMWSQLSALNSLMFLRPTSWSCHIAEDDWLKLGQFSNLRDIAIVGNNDEWEEEEEEWCPLKLEHALAPLYQCHKLRCVRLCGALVLPSEGVRLLTLIPSLKILHLRHVAIESLALLSSAPVLTSLLISGCFDMEGNAFPSRVMLPQLNVLMSLTLIDAEQMEHEQMGQEQIDALNAQLMKRIPRLTPDKFVQRLVRRVPVEPPAVDPPAAGADAPAAPAQPLA